MEFRYVVRINGSAVAGFSVEHQARAFVNDLMKMDNASKVPSTIKLCDNVVECIDEAKECIGEKPKRAAKLLKRAARLLK